MNRARRKVPQVQQLTQTECGLASTLMVMRHHGSKESLRSLREEFDPGRDGLTVRQLRDLLVSRGFSSSMYRAGVGGLATLTLPVIIYWENYHFVVLEKLTPSHATIVDPAGGRRRITIDEFGDSFSGIVITATPNEDYEPVVSGEGSPWPEYLAPMWTARWRVGAIALFSLGLFGASMTVPMLTKTIIDNQLGRGSLNLTWMAAVILAAFSCSYLTLLIVRALVVTSVTVHIGRATMTRIFGHLLFLPYKYFSSRAPGELLFRLNSVNQVRDLMSTQLAQGALDLLLSTFMIGMMFMLSPLLATVAVGCYLLVLFLLVGTRKTVSEALDAEISQSSKSQSMQLESVVAVTALKLSGSEERFFNDWRETYERALRASRRHSNLQGLITAATSSAQIISPLAILLIGAHEAMAGRTTVGTVVAFQSVASAFFGLAGSVFKSYTMAVQARTFLERLSDITQSVKLVDEGQVGKPIRGEIEVRDVGYRYSKHAPAALTNVNMRINPGEKIAIVGSSGSGKSTLGRMLCGLLEPTDGQIIFDGSRMQSYPRAHFYKYVGYVPQEVHLLNRSILSNITMGDPDLGEDDARMAAAEAQVDKDIQALPMQYQTLVSEMGGNFSGGQRQRIALARALVRRPQVLILDEATSSLDTVNEARISQTLTERACTVIVIAHRLSTVVACDRIYVMERGSLVQHGTHDELRDQPGVYRNLFASALAESP